MSEKIEQLKQAYDYCLVQAIEANHKGEFEIEMSWDGNARQILREIESLEKAQRQVEEAENDKEILERISEYYEKA